MNKYILPACIFAFFMTLPLAAHAKKPKASDEPTFTEQQIALNNEAVEASNVGNYSKAEKLYLASLEMGEFNITWLNLGRIYAKENKCREAEQAYARVTDAPKIKNSQKMNIDGILEFDS